MAICVGSCGKVTPTGTPDAAVDANVPVIDAGEPDAVVLNGICGTGATTNYGSLDQCLTDSCCPTFNACAAEANCAACLGGMGTNCDSDPQFAAFNACSETGCPANICGYGISLQDANMEPFVDCHACLNTNCCEPMDRCMVNNPPSDSQLMACLECVNSGPSCDPNLMMPAQEFTTCMQTTCAEACNPNAASNARSWPQSRAYVIEFPSER